MNRITEDVGDFGIRELVRTIRMTDTSILSYGVDLVLDGWGEYPLTLSMTGETQEGFRCITA